MPEISRFFGIVIKMFIDDHNPPHFHAFYGEYEALIDVRDLAVFAGGLPPRVLGLVVEWATGHHGELLDDWSRAQKHEPSWPYKNCLICASDLAAIGWNPRSPCNSQGETMTYSLIPDSVACCLLTHIQTIFTTQAPSTTTPSLRRRRHCSPKSNGPLWQTLAQCKRGSQESRS